MTTSPQVAALRKLDELYAKAEKSGLAKDETAYRKAHAAYCHRYGMAMIPVRFPAKRGAA